MDDYLIQVRTWFQGLTRSMGATDEAAILTALLLIVVTGLIGGVIA